MTDAVAGIADARRLLGLLDLTSLNDSDDAASIERLLSLAETPAGRVAAVCVWPRFVRQARDHLRGSGVAVATVINFPEGTDEPAAVAASTAAAIGAGADEIDVVMPYRAFLAGDESQVSRVLRACRKACGPGVRLKVILETGQLGSGERIRRAAELAIEAGADFLKTSTGKTEPGATLPAAAELIAVIAAARDRGVPAGIKISGGVRTISDANRYVALYEQRFGTGSATSTGFRIGASALLKEIISVLG